MPGNLIKRLRERQVIQTLVIYGAVAWGFYEIAKEYLTQFGFPAYTPRLLLVLLTLGAPAAAFIAWYFDADRRGIRAEQKMRRVDWLSIAASLALPLVGTLAAFPYLSEQSAFEIRDFEATPNSVAVLPFANLTGDDTFGYLADGVAEEITSSLTLLKALSVSARSLSFQVRDIEADVHDIGRDLAVAYVVRGSVQRAGPRFRFSAHLIETATGLSLWSQSEDVTGDELFDGQDRLSAGIADAMANTLEISLGSDSLRQAPPNPEAYRLYLEGRYIWHRRGSMDLQQAVDNFAEAVRIDPGFARGWAALASAYITYPSYSPKGYATWRQAEDAARRAIELDPGLAEPYGVLATFVDYDGDKIEGGRLFRKAVELDDKSATAHYWYGEFLAEVGKYVESMEHGMKAVALDPTYLGPRMHLAFGAFSFGDVERASREFEAVWEIGYRPPAAWGGRFLASVVLGDHERSRQLIESSGLGDEAKRVLHLVIDAESGEIDAAEAVEHIRGGIGIDYRIRIWLYARLGFNDHVFALIDAFLEGGSMVDTRPLWSPGIEIRKDPRFVPMLERIGMIDYWESEGWGDVCRKTDDGIVCDAPGLTPERLAVIYPEA
jgi:TolB-like protein